MARPLKEINWDLVDKLIEAGCNGLEIAAKFRIDADTFYGRFKKEYECSFQDYSVKGQEGGKAEIKTMLHAKALNNKAPGNTTLLMFLARCRLGMKEPETVQLLAANQDAIDQDHTIMQLKYRIAQLECDATERKAKECQ
jgi:hypothetical protein